MKNTLDDIDLSLIAHLQENARITTAELADLVKLSASGVQKRLRKLESNGVIKKYATIIDRKSLGYDLIVFVQVSLKVHSPEAVTEFDSAINAIHEVLECHRVTGGADYLLKAIVRDHEHLDHFLMNQLLPLAAVDRVSSNLVLKQIKETTTIKP